MDIEMPFADPVDNGEYPTILKANAGLCWCNLDVPNAGDEFLELPI
jgi:hypothetical protein